MTNEQLDELKQRISTNHRELAVVYGQAKEANRPRLNFGQLERERDDARRQLDNATAELAGWAKEANRLREGLEALNRALSRGGSGEILMLLTKPIAQHIRELLDGAP